MCSRQAVDELAEGSSPSWAHFWPPDRPSNPASDYCNRLIVTARLTQLAAFQLPSSWSLRRKFAARERLEGQLNSNVLFSSLQPDAEPHLLLCRLGRAARARFLNYTPPMELNGPVRNLPAHGQANLPATCCPCSRATGGNDCKLPSIGTQAKLLEKLATRSRLFAKVLGNKQSVPILLLLRSR